MRSGERLECWSSAYHNSSISIANIRESVCLLTDGCNVDRDVSHDGSICCIDRRLSRLFMRLWVRHAISSRAPFSLLHQLELKTKTTRFHNNERFVEDGFEVSTWNYENMYVYSKLMDNLTETRIIGIQKIRRFGIK